MPAFQVVPCILYAILIALKADPFPRCKKKFLLSEPVLEASPAA